MKDPILCVFPKPEKDIVKDSVCVCGGYNNKRTTKGNL